MSAPDTPSHRAPNRASTPEASGGTASGGTASGGTASGGVPLPYPEAAAALPPTTAAGAALGALRVLAVLLLILLGTPAMLLAALVPGRPGGARPAQWVSMLLSRLFLAASGVRHEVQAPEALRAAGGFVFFNHVSYLDIMAVLAVRPLRFLATAGVRRLPLVGWMAQAAGTVFVARGKDESRRAARESLARASALSPTPIAMAPEGGVQPGPGVAPFRHGAFEVAADAGAPVLLVALAFEPRGRAAWLEGESLLRAFWRLAARTERVTARVVPLPPEAIPSGPPEAEAAQAEARVDAALAGLWRRGAA